ncbi:CAP domain-containing protein [Solicola sp. PLA-1-18]|uniref:CAP domain-containing protein n=1 Tax=Solicola sp. PLA-1-18 TaxID=3380532 RepID=UPI003B8267CF
MTPSPRTLPAVLLAMLVSVTLLLAGPASSASAATRSKAEKAVVKLTNAERSKRDLVKLKKGTCVQRYADRWARSIARREVLKHQDIGKVLRKCKLSSVGENVAVGYRTSRQVVKKGWMKSEGHRANILNPGYRRIGVGVAKSKDGTRYYVQVFGRNA